jgi:hypothetical protein
MKKSNLAIKIVVGLVAAAHIIIGLIGVIPWIPINIVLMFYGAALQINPQIAHIIQMFGAYMLTIGFLGIYAILDPVKNINIIYGVSFLLFLRVIQRLVFAGQAHAIFGISPGYYWGQTVCFLVLAILLLVFKPKAVEMSKA